MKKASDFLQSNLTARLVSVLLAVMLWYVVQSSSTQSISPAALTTTTAVLHGIPIHARISPDMAVLGQNPVKTDVSVSGGLLSVASVQVAYGNLQAVVNARGLKPGVHELPVTMINLPTHATTYTPQVKHVTLDLRPVIDHALKPTLRFQGAVSAGAQLAHVNIGISHVVVRGPDVDVHRVRAVVGTISVVNRGSTFAAHVTWVPVDQNGAVVGGVQCSPSTSMVTVPFRQTSVTVPLVASTFGIPAFPYYVASVQVLPHTIQVTGASAALVNLPPIALSPMNVAGLQQTSTITKTIPIPVAGAHLSSVTATVTVTVVPGVRTVVQHVPIVIRGATSHVRYRLSTSTVDVALFGPQSPALTAQDLEASVQVQGLAAGQSTRETVTVSVPAPWVIQSVTHSVVHVSALP